MPTRYYLSDPPVIGLGYGLLPIVVIASMLAILFARFWVANIVKQILI